MGANSMIDFWVQVLGIVAAAIVFISFFSKDMKTVRIINAIGCVVFITYGLLISAYGVWLLNSATLILHLVMLRRMKHDS